MQTSNKLYKFTEELPLTSGQTLDGFELMVECYGNLNQEIFNIDIEPDEIMVFWVGGMILLALIKF